MSTAALSERNAPPADAALPLPFLSSRWARRAVIFGFWTWLALFFASKDYLSQRALGFGHLWPKALWWKAMEWYGWAVLSIGIFWICRTFYRPGKALWSYALIHVVSGTLFSLVHVGICSIGALIEAHVLETGRSWPFLYKVVFVNHFHFDWLVYAGIVSVWHAVDSYRRFRDREVQAAALETRLARAQLQSLKSQLQPHFLFNTLHSISALNHDDPKGANRMLARLSSLLRLALDNDSAQEVSLKEELEFLQHYLDIEQIRLGDRLTVKMDVAPEALDASVPNLFLQPIVENAIRHGIAPFSAPGQIFVTARRHDQTLLLQVADTGPGLRGKAFVPGVGLRNTQERVQQLYGGRSRFEFADRKEGGFEVTISIPFRPGSNQANGFDGHA
jgi:two-component system LytT family sensor kinase